MLRRPEKTVFSCVLAVYYKHMSIDEQRNNAEQAPLHSNAYGEVAGADGSAVGDVGLSLDQRRQLDSNRHYVASYKQSALGSSFVPPDMRHYHARATNPARVRDQSATANGRQRMNATKTQLVVPKRQTGSSGGGFSEPPARGYNPYS